MATPTHAAGITRTFGLYASRRTLLGTAALALAAAFLVPLTRVHADDGGSARVSHLDGTATLILADGERKPLERGSTVRQGQTVETGPSGKLELQLPDDSVVRLGPSSKLLLREVHFGGTERRFSAKLAFGKVWSKVTRTLGGEAKFEVETDNAVAGVRGTTFRVDANRDRSVLVRVYAGAVAMAPGAALPSASTTKGRKGRVQVAGPKEISRSEWEVLVGRMMSLSVNADGTPGEAVAFTDEEEAGDEWVAWNKERDGE